MIKILNWYILIVCSLLPLYILRFRFFGIPVTLLEALILSLFLFWFIVKGLSENNWRKFFNIESFFYPIIFFLLVAIAATIVSFDKNGALGILKAYFVEPILLFLVIFERSKIGFGKFAIFGLIIAATWLSILAIFQKLTGLAIPADAQNEIAQGRVVAVYNSANSLALFLGPVFGVSLGWFLTKSLNIKSRYFMLLVVIIFLQLLAIILTKSQAGLLAIFGIFALLFLAKYSNFKKQGLPFGIICVFAIFANFVFPVLAFLGLNLGQVFSDETLQNRYYLWRGTINLIADKPLTGAGLDSFKEVYGADYRFAEYGEFVQYPHNLILNFWTELGVLGVIAFFWLGFVFVKEATKNQALKLGLLAAILYILLHGIFDVPFFKNDLSAQFFVLLALTKFKD